MPEQSEVPVQVSEVSEQIVELSDEQLQQVGGGTDLKPLQAAHAG